MIFLGCRHSPVENRLAPVRLKGPVKAVDLEPLPLSYGLPIELRYQEQLGQNRSRPCGLLTIGGYRAYAIILWPPKA